MREARIAAQLKHPNIVPVFTFGEDGSHKFFVMQLIEGVGLDRVIKKLREPPGVVAVEEIYRQFRGDGAGSDAAATRPQKSIRRNSWNQLGRIALQAAAALQYAHEQGTLHRDVKPGNLLIDTQGNVWIADFGLALSNDSRLQSTQAPMAGTLRYMAPEQFRGEFDARSDIYALGATLYELCTLKPAFPGQDRTKVARAVRKQRLTPPSQHVAGIPNALEQIILKAMRRDPQERYQSAEELRMDLLRFLNPQRRAIVKELWSWAVNRLSGPKQRPRPAE